MAAAENELTSLRAELAIKKQGLASLEAAIAAASSRETISAGERASLEGRAAALGAALQEKERALSAALKDCAALRSALDASRLETERLRLTTEEHSLSAQEQRHNFTGAVAQVFELQKRAAGLKSALAAAQEQAAALSSELKQRADDIEKVNGLLREAKLAGAQEKEVSRRASLKIKALDAELGDLKTRLAASGDYSARLLKAVEARDQQIAALHKDLNRIPEVELENEDLRRKNIKFSGLLMREQADFTARMLASLEKTARDLKAFNLRIPAAERKALEPGLRNLLGSVNLLKGWQEYLDPETPELEETDLAGFVRGETEKWERAFKQRKISVSSAILNPRLRASVSPERLKILFYQLVKNAYERLQQGGSLRVTLKGSEDGREALLAFEDTGPGFVREALDKLFAPFNTTDKGKAGIGLAVARRIAEKHGGTLTVANKAERGAVVEVRLPLGNAAP
jgi:signal transduction histidine kinase